MCLVSSAGERRFYTARVGSSILSPGTRFREDVGLRARHVLRSRNTGSNPAFSSSFHGVYSVVVCTSVCEAEGTSSILVTHPKVMAT